MAWWRLWGEKPARVLAGDDQMFDGRLVLTDDALYVLPQEKEIRYDVISSVRANWFGDDLDIYHRRSSLPLDDYTTNVTFKDTSARDTALEALEQRLAPRFQRHEVQYGVVRAGFAPFLMGVLVALFTYGSMWVAVLFAAGDEADFVKAAGQHATAARLHILVCRWLGPTGVAIVGGLVVFGCIVWLVKRVKQPPLMITLSPSD
ncbi:MAG TPA: hypothetical protein VGN09_03885 [Vicinamibacteria bacterium]|jgi:hypothetical protein